MLHFLYRPVLKIVLRFPNNFHRKLFPVSIVSSPECFVFIFVILIGGKSSIAFYSFLFFEFRPVFVYSDIEQRRLKLFNIRCLVYCYRIENANPVYEHLRRAKSFRLFCVLMELFVFILTVFLFVLSNIERRILSFRIPFSQKVIRV